MGKESTCNAGDARDMGFIPGQEDHLEEGIAIPTPVFLPGQFHGQRSLADYSPQGRKDLDTTEAAEHTQACSPIVGKEFLFYIFSKLVLQGRLSSRVMSAEGPEQSLVGRRWRSQRQQRVSEAARESDQWREEQREGTGEVRGEEVVA